MNSLHTHKRAINANSKSPHVKFRSIDVGDCVWAKGFWADKFKQAEGIIVPNMGAILKGDVGHAYNNFKVAAGLQSGEAKGML